MSKLTVTEAVKVIPVSESKLRRDMKAGVVSYEVDEKGKKRFDPSELVRVYGEIDLLENNGQVKENNPNPSKTRHDSAEIIALKDNQIADLRNQLERTETQLEIASSEKTKLLDLLSAEKSEKREIKAEMIALMPPPDERVEKPEQPEIKPRGWLQRLIGVG